MSLRTPHSAQAQRGVGPLAPLDLELMSSRPPAHGFIPVSSKFALFALVHALLQLLCLCVL